jgi:hypothetical protein
MELTPNVYPELRSTVPPPVMDQLFVVSSLAVPEGFRVVANWIPTKLEEGAVNVAYVPLNSGFAGHPLPVNVHVHVWAKLLNDLSTEVQPGSNPPEGSLRPPVEAPATSSAAGWMGNAVASVHDAWVPKAEPAPRTMRRTIHTPRFDPAVGLDDTTPPIRSVDFIGVFASPSELTAD